MGVNVQLFGLATCQNTHGGPFVTEGNTSLLGFLGVWYGGPLAGYSFGLQIGKLRCCPESAPGTFLELLQSWLVRHGLSEICCRPTTAPTGPCVGGWRGPAENCCTEPQPRFVRGELASLPFDVLKQLRCHATMRADSITINHLSPPVTQLYRPNLPCTLTSGVVLGDNVVDRSPF